MEKRKASGDGDNGKGAGANKAAFFNTAADRPGMQRVTELPLAGLRPTHDLMGWSTQTGNSSGGD